MTEYKQRATHSQISAGLRKVAKSEGMPANDIYSRFFRELFLAELISKNSGWVLKGGTNLNCLIPGARHTRDLDLYRQDPPTDHRDAAQQLIAEMDGAVVGPYIFDVKIPSTNQHGGSIENIQLTVVVLLAGVYFRGFQSMSLVT